MAIVRIINDSSSWIDSNDTREFTSPSARVEFHSTRYGFLPTLVLGVVAGLTSLVTITGNLVVILSFILERSIRQPSNYFIASLAVSDLLIGTVSMPFYTAYLLAGHYWLLGEVLCDLWLSIDYSACLCSIYTIFCITVDRYCSVKMPAKYRAWRTNRKILFIIATIWTIPVLVFFTSIFGWQHFVGERSLKEGECTVQYLQNVVFSTLLQIGYFWVTLVIMCSLYAGIYMAALRLQKKSEEKRKKIAQLLANTPTTKSQKVFLERSQLGSTARGVGGTGPTTSGEATDRAPSSAKLLSTSYFRISSSSMALSSLTESEKSPTTLAEEKSSDFANPPRIEGTEKPSPSDEVTSKLDPESDVFQDEPFPVADSRPVKRAIQSPVAAADEAGDERRHQDGESFSKSQTTETSLSGLCFEGQPSSHRATVRPDDRGRFHGRKQNRNAFAGARSGRQVPANTEETSDDSGNGMDSRNSSVVWKDHNPPRTSGEIFTISSSNEMEQYSQEQREQGKCDNKAEEQPPPYRFKSSLARACCSLAKKSKISGELREGTTSGDRKNNPKSQPSRREDRALKALRTITIILGAFLVCWTPWHVLAFIMGFCSSCVDSRLYDVSYWFCYINSPINPFCYAFANQQFKKTFVRIFRLDWQRT